MRNVWFRTTVIFLTIILVFTSISSVGYGKPIESYQLKNNSDLNEIIDIKRDMFLRWNPRKITVRYDMTVTNAGNTTVNITTYLAQPDSHVNQELQGPIIYDPVPDGLLTDRWGQTVAYYSYTLLPDYNISLSWQANATIYTVRYILLPWKINGEIPEEIRENYTVDDSQYQINDPYIQEIVNDVLGNTKSLLMKAVKLHKYVIDHLEYVIDDKWDDAPTVLKRGNGSCSEYCFAYIALCRAAGIPARYNGGTLYKKEPPHIDTVYHRIVEIYFPSYGWIPVDVTWDDSTWLRHFYFGLHLNNLFTLTVGGGSSQYLNWSYTTWQDISPPSDDIIVNKSITWLQWERPRMTMFTPGTIRYNST